VYPTSQTSSADCTHPLREHRDRIALFAPPSDAAPGQQRLGFGQSFQHEAVMAQVGLRVAVGQCEDHQHGQVQAIGPVDGVFQCRIVMGPLGLLHPVEHPITVSHGSIVEGGDSLRLNSFHWIIPRFFIGLIPRRPMTRIGVLRPTQ
jgi:hypothetical protein